MLARRVVEASEEVDHLADRHDGTGMVERRDRSVAFVTVDLGSSASARGRVDG